MYHIIYIHIIIYIRSSNVTLYTLLFKNPRFVLTYLTYTMQIVVLQALQDSQSARQSLVSSKRYDKVFEF